MTRLAGWHHSEEARAKIAAAGRERVFSEETRAKISMAHKGRTYSQETIEKMRIAAKARMTEEVRAKMSAAKKGKRVSPEVLAKRVDWSERFGEKISARMKGTQHALGHKHSDGAKERMAAAKRGKRQNPEHIAKCAAARIGKKRSEETKAKIAKAHIGMKVSEEVKVKLSEINSGPNHPQWQGGISAEPYCQEWMFGGIKEYIKERDGHKCMNLGCYNNNPRLCAHHIDYQKKNCGRENLITLCTPCNSKANFNREGWTALYRLILNHRYDYKYLE